MKYCIGIIVLNMIGALGCNEKIGILSYGSLVHRPQHSITGIQIKAYDFKPTKIFFPINLSLLANTNRITAVIDNENGAPRAVWAALSQFNKFDLAINNLAAREGAQYFPDAKKYDTRYIFYVRKILFNKVNAEEQIIPSFPGWVIKNDSKRRQKLADILIEQIIEWAQNNNIQAVIWTSCPIVPMARYQFIEHLLNDSELLKNAQEYVRILPGGPQTTLEKAIMAGNGALQRLLSKQSMSNYDYKKKT